MLAQPISNVRALIAFNDEGHSVAVDRGLIGNDGVEVRDPLTRIFNRFRPGRSELCGSFRSCRVLLFLKTCFGFRCVLLPDFPGSTFR